MCNTTYFALLSVPLSIALAIGLALMLSWKIRGQAIFRAVFFLPSIVPLLAAAVLFTLPVLIPFLFAQRTFLKGISTTGIKG